MTYRSPEFDTAHVKLATGDEKALKVQTYRPAGPVGLIVRIGLGVRITAHEIEIIVPGDRDAALGRDDGTNGDVDECAAGAEPWTLSNTGQQACGCNCIRSWATRWTVTVAMATAIELRKESIGQKCHVRWGARLGRKAGKRLRPDLTTTMSPLRHSLTSRTKKSALG